MYRGKRRIARAVMRIEQRSMRERGGGVQMACFKAVNIDTHSC
jgi:hypothetical protein